MLFLQALLVVEIYAALSCKKKTSYCPETLTGKWGSQDWHDGPPQIYNDGTVKRDPLYPSSIKSNFTFFNVTELPHGCIFQGSDYWIGEWEGNSFDRRQKMLLAPAKIVYNQNDGRMDGEYFSGYVDYRHPGEAYRLSIREIDNSKNSAHQFMNYLETTHLVIPFHDQCKMYWYWTYQKWGTDENNKTTANSMSDVQLLVKENCSSPSQCPGLSSASCVQNEMCRFHNEQCVAKCAVRGCDSCETDKLCRLNENQLCVESYCPSEDSSSEPSQNVEVNVDVDTSVVSGNRRMAEDAPGPDSTSDRNLRGVSGRHLSQSPSGSFSHSSGITAPEES